MSIATAIGALGGLSDLQATYDVSVDGEIVLVDTKPFVIDGNAMSAGNPFFIVQNSSVNVMEFNSLGGFIRGALIADGIFASLREVRFTSDGIGSPGWAFRPRTDAIPSGPALLGFDSTISSATESSSNMLLLLPEDQTFTANFNKIEAGANYSLNFVNASFGAFLALNGVIQFQQNGQAFGSGLVVNHSARWEPVGAANFIGPIFTFVHQPRISANGLAGIVHSQTRDYTSQPTYAGDGGALTVSLAQQFMCSMTILTGATVVIRHGLRMLEAIGAGVLQTQRCISIENIIKGTVENTGIWSVMAAGANNRFLKHTGTAQSDFGGAIAMGAGAAVPDWILSRLAPNVATLAAGDSLRISTGLLFFGAAGSINLSEGVANRLDLGTGDSFRIINGALEHLAGTVGFFGSAPAGQAADPVALTDGTTGTANNALVAIAGTGDDANINDNFADLTAKYNALRAIVRQHGLAA